MSFQWQSSQTSSESKEKPEDNKKSFINIEPSKEIDTTEAEKASEVPSEKAKAKEDTSKVRS